MIQSPRAHDSAQASSYGNRPLEGRCAVVFGASRGIGAAAARALADAGARVVLAARDAAALDVLATELRSRGADVLTATVDVADAASISAAVDLAVAEFGRLDIGVNNAGVNGVRRSFHELDDDMFDSIVDVNLRGVFVGMKHQIRAMLKTGKGSIVNTASAAGHVAFNKMAGYVASKHGVIGLTKAAALEYAPHGIRVNAVSPGAVLTEMLMKGSAATPEGRAMVESATPMRRIGAPREIAEAIVWLASDASSFVTGADLPVDGGYSLP